MGFSRAVAFAAVGLPIAWFWPMPVDLRTSPAGATLRIDGTIRGQSTLHLKLRPGEHRVEISKTGYASSSQVLNVRRWPSGLLNARLRSVEFELKPLPTLASLSIRGGVPGTEVRIDGKPAGTFAADGSFLNQEVWPGRHEIQLSARRFKSKPIYSDFKAGAPVVISEAMSGIVHGSRAAKCGSGRCPRHLLAFRGHDSDG